MKRNDLVFAWFASWHSLLPVLFASLQKKPSLLVTGGYDTANIPSAKYGNQRLWWKRSITNFILRRSSHIICNSRFAKQEVQAIIGALNEKISVIYHGIPEGPVSVLPKSDIALNVGNVLQENLLRKGIEPFLATGNLLPSYHFIQAGQWKDNSFQKLRKYIAANVELRGFAGEEELQALYSRSRVYIQPSLHEAFGMSVAEAMLAGCIPIVSPCGALMEVVGKYGIILEDTSPEAISRGIVKAGNYRYSPYEIRQFVVRNYSLTNRKNGLLKCLAQFNKNA